MAPRIQCGSHAACFRKRASVKLMHNRQATQGLSVPHLMCQQTEWTSTTLLWRFSWFWASGAGYKTGLRHFSQFTVGGDLRCPRAFILVIINVILFTCYTEVIAIDNEATTSTTKFAVGDILSTTTSSQRLPVVSLNFAGNNELPAPATTTRHVVDNTLKYSRTTLHGKSRASSSPCQCKVVWCAV